MDKISRASFVVAQCLILLVSIALIFLFLLNKVDIGYSWIFVAGLELFILYMWYVKR